MATALQKLYVVSDRSQEQGMVIKVLDYSVRVGDI